MVEKVDMVTIFNPICRKYHIPIANSRGFSSILQRANIGRRFKESERYGRRSVLLVYGDHDPSGLVITSGIRNLFKEMDQCVWENKETCWTPPDDFIVERIGINWDFIKDHGIPLIEGLSTSRKVKHPVTGKQVWMNLENPLHPKHNLEYVQDYIRDFGPYKCEANAIVTNPKPARDLFEKTILSYLGDDVTDRYEAKDAVIQDIFDEFMRDTGLGDAVQAALDSI